jgi:DNA repair protein RecN (Recombination protein N)
MPKGDETAERLDSCLIELRDISDELAAMLDATDFDPAEMDAVNQRLDLIYSLEKKHRTDSVEELIAIRDSLAEKVNQINTSDELLQELAERMHREETLCREKAAALTARRQEAARKIEHYIPEGLVPLGMPHVKFEVRLTSTDLGRQGQDRVDFYFSANTSTELQPIATVASGGEIARVMLTLKAIISKAVKLPTIIFDEIDTGVSGKIAEQMAAIMTQMGNDDRQVISITHLPQIAAKGRHHYKVEKQERAEGTVSIMRRLDNDERVAEIAQMLSGSDVTAAAVENAKALLDIK